MNITDVETQEVNGDRLRAIFARQQELVVKYQEIEGMPEYPFSPHSRIGQKFFKDFAWRMTEELVEAVEAFQNASDSEDDTELQAKHMMHFEEEIIDALHFLVENLILAGITPDDFTEDKEYLEQPGTDILDSLYNTQGCLLIAEAQINPEDTSFCIEEVIMLPIIQIGLAMNCLKNKPWKQTEILTDVPKFTRLMKQALHDFIRMCICIDIDDQKLTDLYFKKAAVNSFRQRSKY